MWRAESGGRRLRFHLVGINNQNFLMQDEETGSWWQQVTGEAIQGPLRGSHLELVASEEVSFGLFRREHPAGRVLRPVSSARLFDADWEARTARLPVPTARPPAGPLAPRELVVGLTLAGSAKAYPWTLLERQRLILDRLGGAGGVGVAIGIGEDGRSARAFEAAAGGHPLTLFARVGSAPAAPAGAPAAVAAPAAGAAPGSSPLWIDAETGSDWDFSGRAVRGPLAGRQLRQLPMRKEYWFDWQAYHPATEIYRPPL